MSSDRPQKPRSSNRPEAGLHVWPKLQRALERERKVLREISSEEGLTAARLEQDHRLIGLDDPELIEQMFFEGVWREPEAARYVESARRAYQDLMTTLQPEHEEQFKELSRVRRNLLIALWQLQQQVHRSAQQNTPLVITLDLGHAHEILQGYLKKSLTTPEIIQLVQEIKLLLDDLDLLAKQFSG